MQASVIWQKIRKKLTYEQVFLGLVLVFLTGLMFRSFYIANGTIWMGFHIWSDFSSNFPLIRSFSLGDNWPPEHPMYPGPPIKYHFLFFSIVGWLERLGIRLDFALNLPSILGFWLCFVFIYKISFHYFKDKRISTFAVLFFLFHGTLGFVKYFQAFGINYPSIMNIFSLVNHPEPMVQPPLSGYWNLHLYINQRHLCIGYAFVLAIVWTLIQCDKYTREKRIKLGILYGIGVGLLPLFHKPILIILAVVFLIYFLTVPSTRLFIFIIGAVSLVLVGITALMGLNILLGSKGPPVSWYPGFLAHDNLTIGNVLHFWWWSWGLHIVLAPIGFYLAFKKSYRLIVFTVVTFLIGFLFKFSEDLWNNHKFFSFVLVFTSIYSSLALFRIYDAISKKRQWKLVAARVGVVVVIVTMTLSGLIHTMVLMNQYMAAIDDLPKNKAAQWFYENTPDDSVVLNSTFFYHPASVAGRKVFLGWVFFLWSAGYDFDARRAIIAEFFSGKDKSRTCEILHQNNIYAFTVQDTSKDSNFPPTNLEFFNQFTPGFVSDDGQLKIFKTSAVCPTESQG